MRSKRGQFPITNNSNEEQVATHIHNTYIHIHTYNVILLIFIKGYTANNSDIPFPRKTDQSYIECQFFAKDTACPSVYFKILVLNSFIDKSIDKKYNCAYVCVCTRARVCVCVYML